jgi:hypothetical protein
VSSNSSTSNSDSAALFKYVPYVLRFAIPLLLYSGAIVAVDPFRMFSPTGLFSVALKERTAQPVNPCLWKLIDFDRNPESQILLGDSRMDGLLSAWIESQTGDRYRNLGYGGATMNEIMDSFWFASSRTKLKKVTIGVNLNIYNAYVIYRRTEAVDSFFSNRLLYFTNRNVLEATWNTYRAALTGADPQIGKVSEDREAFWRSVLASQEIEYGRWTDPKEYRKKLAAIADWCRANQVDLTFVIFPSHHDIHEIMQRTGRLDDLARMKTDLRSFGRLVDFENDGPFTMDRTNYDDPLHLTQAARRILITQIWPDRLH